ncbi:MAG: transketolase [Candidatus Aenigmatarchaeota archaeon]|nr:MAG: transketolase [Candidatus Aenigmarchaeota archaeon]RLJ08735.1 MAG: transketolase [Candidatus Aenigmarchaeota archaeon]
MNNGLKKISARVKKNILLMLKEAGSGHTGGSLSCADILVTLYFGSDSEGKKLMRYEPENPFWEGRDRLVLSKGHAAPALYAVLSEVGYIPEEELFTLRKLGSRLQGHVDKQMLPFLETSTGSLGQGVSIGKGMALSFKIDKKPNRVYVVAGDGELQEGQVWEAARNAKGLDNLTLIVDYNGWSIDSYTDCLYPLRNKFEAFGWYVIGKEIPSSERKEDMHMDGHDPEKIAEYITEAKEVREYPQCVILNTWKGGDIYPFKNNPKYHGKAPTDEELEIAFQQLDRLIGDAIGNEYKRVLVK